MKFFKRFGYFILTNILVMVTIGIVWSLVSHFLGVAGVNQYLPLLMAFCLVLGFNSLVFELSLDSQLFQRPKTKSPKPVVNRIRPTRRSQDVYRHRGRQT